MLRLLFAPARFPRSVALLPSSRALATAAKKLTPEQIARKQIKSLPLPELARPKRPSSAYILFSNDKRHAVYNDLGSKDIRLVGKELGSLWKSASDSEKEHYQNLALKTKAEYEREFQYYLDNRPPSDVVLEKKLYALKKSLKIRSKGFKPVLDPKAPRAFSAYQIFTKDMWAAPQDKQIEVLGETLGGFDFVAGNKIIQSVWKKLPDDEKSVYTARAKKSQAEKAEYDAEHGLDIVRKTVGRTAASIRKPATRPKRRLLIKKKPKKLVRKARTKKVVTKAKATKKKTVAKKPVKKLTKAVTAIKKVAKKEAKVVKKGVKKGLATAKTAVQKAARSL